MASHRFRPGLTAVGLAFTAIILAGCISIDINEDAFSGEDGSGDLVTETRAVTDFSAVEISGALHVEVEVGGSRVVEAFFDDNLLDNLETVVSRGTLRISCRDCSPSRGAVIRIAAPELDRIEVNGASHVVANDVSTERLTVDVSGASELEIDGRVDALRVDGSGASDIDGEHLTAITLEVDLSGASSATIEVVERVDGQLSGASSLHLSGDLRPTIDVNTSGASSIDR
jgi:hypothetical protein